MDQRDVAPYPVEAFEMSGPLLDALVDVYLDANRSNDDPARRRGLFVRHTLEPGWRAVAAGEPPVGFAYGFHCMHGQWWHDSLKRGLRARCGRKAVRRWLTDAFCLAELHVRRDWQRHGVGRALVDTLLAGREERTVVLSTPDDAAARTFYPRLGFTELMSEFVFVGTPAPYTVFGRELS